MAETKCKQIDTFRFSSDSAKGIYCLYSAGERSDRDCPAVVVKIHNKLNLTLNKTFMIFKQNIHDIQWLQLHNLPSPSSRQRTPLSLIGPARLKPAHLQHGTLPLNIPIPPKRAEKTTPTPPYSGAKEKHLANRYITPQGTPCLRETMSLGVKTKIYQQRRHRTIQDIPHEKALQRRNLQITSAHPANGSYELQPSGTTKDCQLLLNTEQALLTSYLAIAMPQSFLPRPTTKMRR